MASVIVDCLHHTSKNERRKKLFRTENYTVNTSIWDPCVYGFQIAICVCSKQRVNWETRENGSLLALLHSALQSEHAVTYELNVCIYNYDVSTFAVRGQAQYCNATPARLVFILSVEILSA
jgi:hypothetical protein